MTQDSGMLLPSCTLIGQPATPTVGSCLPTALPVLHHLHSKQSNSPTISSCFLEILIHLPTMSDPQDYVRADYHVILKTILEPGSGESPSLSMLGS